MASLVTKMLADVERAKKASKKVIADCRDNPMVPDDVAYTLAHKTFKSFLDDKADTINLLCDMMENPDDKYAQAMQRLVDIVANKSSDVRQKQWYMVTIRPDCTKCHFLEFKEKVETLLERKCFIEGSYSYEQKATSPSDIGTGFHVHIVTKMKQASKGQVLRDVTSSFKDWIDKGFITANNLDVRTTKNPDDLIDNYLLEYKSDDGHKETTQAMDELWRTSMGLKRIYTLTQ